MTSVAATTSRGEEGRPIILVSNDDGVDAAGIAALASAAASLGEVWVVAPAVEQSGVSSALSLHSPLRIHVKGERVFAVTGTPADCVYMALQHILPRRPALCLSGVNHGANLADDVLYSGTVAAAIEATISEVPSVAVSLAAYGKGLDYGEAARVAVEYGAKVLARGLPRDTLLNINVPRGGRAEGTARRVCKLGRRNYMRQVSEQQDPRGRSYYWIGGAEIDFDDLPGSDCNAIVDGVISVTPLQVDMTRHRFLKELSQW